MTDFHRLFRCSIQHLFYYKTLIIFPGETTVVKNCSFSLIDTENDKFDKEENIIFNKTWVRELLQIKDIHHGSLLLKQKQQIENVVGRQTRQRCDVSS